MAGWGVERALLGGFRVHSAHELKSTKATKPRVFSAWLCINRRVNRYLVFHRRKVRRSTSTWRKIRYLRRALGANIHDSFQPLRPLFRKQEVDLQHKINVLPVDPDVRS